MREHFRGKSSAACAKRKLAAVIIFGDDRCDRMIAEIGNCVHMCDKTKSFAGFQAFCRRKMGINIAVFVKRDIGDAKLFQLINKNAGQVKLALGGRRCGTFLIAWGKYFYIG